MFDFSYRTRCLLCRAGFLAGCVVPSLAMLVWAGWLRHPGHVEHYERAIEAELRLSARLKMVSHPRPVVTIYEGLELADPETGAAIARLPRLEVGGNGDELVLIARRAEVFTATWRQWSQRIDERLRASDAPLVLSAVELVLTSPEGSITLEQAQARLETSPEGRQWIMQFQLAGGKSPQPVQLCLTGTAEQQEVVTGLKLDTGDTPLPCSLLEPALPWLAELGPRATFSGRAQAFRGPQGWRGEIAGRFSDIDLNRLIGSSSTHEISGLAELRLTSARFANNRLSDVEGRLTAGPGSIGHSLLLAAVRSLQLQYHEAAVRNEQPLLYEELALDFRLDASGLLLQGSCGQAPAGALLADGSQWLLGEPQQQPQPVVGLLHLLAPPGSPLAPASRQLEWLQSLLPLP